ncbi:MAG: RNA 2',3'-cyclic phosphodiesterase [Anaerolineaceae bacterium]|jgi:2'-5' RNA ligase|nr:RNA 2',3'-cyclic phosphodiesterase [Anaerolineaceae bacterium]
MKPETIRSFIAIPLPPAAQDTIAEWLDALQKRQRRGVRWVDAAKMHLTMKFLGDILPEQIPAIQQAMRVAAAEFRVFTFDLKGLGAFPGVYKPRVIWVSIIAPPALQQLQHHLEKHLAVLGFPAEDRRFSPHLTLGRISRHASEKDMAGVSALLRQPPKIALSDVPVDALYLYRSDLHPDGSVYTLLERSPLKES